MRFYLFRAAIFLSISLGSAVAHGTEQLAEKTIQQLQAIEEDRQRQSPIENKMSSRLLGAVRAIEGSPRVEKVPHLRSYAEISNGGLARISVNGKITPELESFVKSQGGTEIVTLTQYGRMSTRFPLAKVRKLAERPEVVSLDLSAKRRSSSTPSSTSSTLSNTVDAEGDIAHDAAIARQQFKTTGAGETICVISDSLTSIDDGDGHRIDHLTNAQKNGSLPGVKIIRDYMGSDGRGEGVAMLEIVHRIAPDAKLVFTTGGAKLEDMVASVTDLLDPVKVGNCTIIADDQWYDDESPFGDGPMSQKVAEASNRDILWFSSAGNNNHFDGKNSGTWEGDFSPSPIQLQLGRKIYSVHEFQEGSPFNTISDIDSDDLKPKPCECIKVTLWWSDPPDNAPSDYIIAVVDQNDNIMDYSSGLRPYNVSSYAKMRAGQNSRLVILKEASAPVRFIHLATNETYLDIGTTGAISSHHASGAENAFAVASKDACGRTAPFLAGKDEKVRFSSADGPRRIFFDYDANGNVITITSDLTAAGGKTLMKPDLTAASCVTTDVSTMSTFRGTSAAAPHAAAIAALIKSARPDWKPAQIRKALTTTALDIEAPGWDALSGYGIVMPGPALAWHP
jgi:hypothetical protein